MKSKREEFLAAEYERMKKRSQEERAKIQFAQFIDKELDDNKSNRLNPKWRKAWDEFHEQWLKNMLPRQHVGPLTLKTHMKHLLKKGTV
jgi:hypothetical protein